MSAATLQIITINDVYEIDNLPSFSTCVKTAKANPLVHKVISTLPGDFVAPSLLSSLDKGASMIECLNICELDYCSIGNHESDIPLNHLHNRMRESKFKWINSNMKEFPLPADIVLPEYEIVEVKGEGGHTRRVALIGLCGEDRSVMKPGSFNNCFIEPVLDAGARWYQYLLATEKVDCVIPLTHQLIGFDRIMAQQQVGYPVIIGGHDHEPFNEEYGNCKVIKVGMDAQRIGIINITWPDAACPRPIVTITEKEAKDIEADPAVALTTVKCKQVLVEIERSKLCEIPKGVTLSSIGMRLCPTSIGTFICTTIKRAVNCEICVCGAGCIRASKSYEGRTDFTYADLKAEMPFNTLIQCINLPGRVCAQIIEYTRAFALQNPPVVKGGYLQTDDKVIWDESTNTVIAINGAPLEPDRIYRACINLGMLNGLDDVRPLMDWKATCSPSDTNAYPDEDTSLDAKETIVSYFSQSLMFHILNSGGGRLAKLDSDRDGKISKEELKQYLLADAATCEGDSPFVTNMLVNNLFASLDTDGNGEVTVSEMFELSVRHMSDIAFSKVHDTGLVSISECLECLKALHMDAEGDAGASANAGVDTTISTAELSSSSSAATSETDGDGQGQGTSVFSFTTQAHRTSLMALAKRIDTDADGFITREEFLRYLAASQHERGDISKRMTI